MKALIIGQTANIENGISMVNGLNNMGIENGYFGYRSFARKYGIEAMKQQILDLISEHQPDWMLCQYQHTSSIPPDFFQNIRDHAPDAKISLMSVDMRNNLDEITIRAGKFVDVCFQKGRVNFYKKYGLNCKLLQEGYSDLLFYKKGLKKEYDIIFAGNFYPQSNFPGTQERVITVSQLSKYFNIKVIGSGWDRILPMQNCLGPKSLNDINEHYNKSKIILNINHYNDIEDYWSIRMIEGMASGNLMVTKYIPNLEKYFKNHHDIVWFYSLADCIDVVKYYLKNGSEREKIASRGIKSVESFKWENIMKEAFNKVFPEGEI